VRGWERNGMSVRHRCEELALADRFDWIIASVWLDDISIYLKTSFRGTGILPVRHGRDAHATF
jgi:hypothetical protein